MTTSQIFSAAHAAAKVADALVAYRARFVAALKAAWKQAKTKLAMSYDSKSHDEWIRADYERNLANARDLNQHDNQLRVGYVPSVSKPGLWISTDWRNIKLIKDAFRAGELDSRKHWGLLYIIERRHGNDVEAWARATAAMLKQEGVAQFLTREEVQEKLNSLEFDNAPALVRF